MSYDPLLVERIRRQLQPIDGIEEKERMGGISFMRRGQVLVRAHNDGTMMLRCEPDMTDDLLQKPSVERFTVKGKTAMRGWLLVGPEGTATDEDLATWIDVALAYNDAGARR